MATQRTATTADASLLHFTQSSSKPDLGASYPILGSVRQILRAIPGRRPDNAAHPWYWVGIREGGPCGDVDAGLPRHDLDAVHRRASRGGGGGARNGRQRQA